MWKMNRIKQWCVFELKEKKIVLWYLFGVDVLFLLPCTKYYTVLKRLTEVDFIDVVSSCIFSNMFHVITINYFPHYISIAFMFIVMNFALPFFFSPCMRFSQHYFTMLAFRFLEGYKSWLVKMLLLILVLFCRWTKRKKVNLKHLDAKWTVINKSIISVIINLNTKNGNFYYHAWIHG